VTNVLTPQNVGIAVAGLLTLAVLSYLIRATLLYQVTQHVFVGITAGYALVVAYHQVLLPKLVYPLAEAPGRQPGLLVVALLGALMFARLVRPSSWPASFPVSLVVGVGAALALAGALAGTLVPQSLAAAPELWRLGAPPGDIVGGWVLIGGVIAVLASFTILQSKPGGTGGGAALDSLRRGGRWLLMLSFGALFANIAVSRFAMLAGRISFLAHEWLPLLFGGG